MVRRSRNALGPDTIKYQIRPPLRHFIYIKYAELTLSDESIYTSINPTNSHVSNHEQGLLKMYPDTGTRCSLHEKLL